MTTEQEIALAQTLLTGLESLAKAYLSMHDDKIAAEATLQDLIAEAARAPEVLADTEAAHDAIADNALDGKFPPG